MGRCLWRRLPAVAVVVLVIAVTCANGWAFNFFELEVYPYQTEGQGVAELEWLQSFVPKGHSQPAEPGQFATDSMYRSSVELTYGLTDHLEAAYYVDEAHPNGNSVQYAGSRFRLRGSLFEAGELPADFGWYAELEWVRSPQFSENQLELDLRPIIERDFGRVAVLLNPIIEVPVDGPGVSGGPEFQYAAKIGYRYSPRFSPGLEFYGDIGKFANTDPLHAQGHYIFPAVNIQLPEGLQLNFGAGVGLTRGSDQIITKVNLEFERFVGMLL